MNAIGQGSKGVKTIAEIASFLPLLGPAINAGTSTYRFMHALKVRGKENFVNARNTGIGVESARVSTRLSIFNTCRLFQLQQAQLAAYLKLSNADADSDALAAFEMLGLPETLKALMSVKEQNEEKEKLSFGHAVRAAISKVLNPVHHRINAVFRTYGICGGGSIANPPYSSHDPVVAKFVSNELADANAANPSAPERAFMPTFSTCHDDDIYDIVRRTRPSLLDLRSRRWPPPYLRRSLRSPHAGTHERRQQR